MENFSRCTSLCRVLVDGAAPLARRVGSRCNDSYIRCPNSVMEFHVVRRMGEVWGSWPKNGECISSRTRYRLYADYGVDAGAADCGMLLFGFRVTVM